MGGPAASEVADSEADQTKVAPRMTGGLFNANSKIDPGSIEEALSEVPSEQVRASGQNFGTSRDNVRKSAKSAPMDSDEEEKIFNIGSENDMQRLSEAVSEAIERATTPGEADQVFAEFVIALELEMQAETGQLKHQNPDTVDLNYERRMLF